MSRGVKRWIAQGACAGLEALLPASLQHWARAVRAETDTLPDDDEALRFALGSLFGLLPRAVLSRIRLALAPGIRHDPLDSGDTRPMSRDAANLLPVGITCAIAAVTLGLAYLGMAGAPTPYLAINAAALVLGLALMALVRRSRFAGRSFAAGAILCMACALLATALLGDPAAGAARWVNLGGLSIQPSLVLLPVMLVAFVRTRGAMATLGLVAAAAAMALQPDRAMAGMMVAALAVLAMIRPDRQVATALLASVLGFAATLLREDTLPAVPYVDEILYSAFHVHAAAGTAVLAGSLLLVVPAFVGWFRDPGNRATYAVFGVAWFAAILAAALGNYPTPLVGYGGSAILGYALSLLAMPRRVAASASKRSSALHGPTTKADRHLRFGLA